MCLGVRTTLNKLIFYILLAALWAGAAAFIGIGIYLAVENPNLKYSSIYTDYDTAVWDAAVYILISAGAVLAGVGFAGLCGARQGSNCLLWIFNVSMLVFVGTELALMIMAGVFQGEVEDGLRLSMERQVSNDYVGPDADDLSRDWDSMQRDLQCCGSNYYTDYYLYSDFTNRTGQIVPYTCCEGEMDNYNTCKEEAAANVPTEEIQYLYRDGCFLQMMLLKKEQTSMIVATACIVAGIQVGALFIGCFLRDNMKKSGKMDA